MTRDNHDSQQFDQLITRSYQALRNEIPGQREAVLTRFATACAVNPGARRMRPVPAAVLALASSSQPRQRYRYVASVGTAAAVAVVTIGLLVWNGTRQPAVSPKALAHKVGSDEKPPSPRMSPSQMSDASGELQEILARVDALQREIQVTAQQAELLDARRQADQMIATYSRW